MSPPKITVAMLGARMNYAVPRILHRSGQLQALVTDVYLPAGPSRRVATALERLPGTIGGLRALLGRHHTDLDGARIIDRGMAGALDVVRRRKAKDTIHQRAIKHSGSQRLADLIADRLPNPGDAIFAFHEVALESFTIAKARGLGCILEQSIIARPASARILSQEVPRWKDWFDGDGMPDLTPRVADRSRAEWDAADTILAASDFVRDSLVFSGVDRTKIVVVPYGVSLPVQAVTECDYAADRPLRLLFAGNVQLRKGVPYLLDAVLALGPKAVELRVAGNVGLKPEIVDRYATTTRFLGRVPRQDMPALYRWADVFVLPSLVEGSATVTYEALSHGVPAIVTPNAGSVIEHDVEGQVIAASSSEQIVTAISRYLDDPDLVRRHADGARAARNKVSYERYERDLGHFFQAYEPPGCR